MVHSSLAHILIVEDEGIVAADIQDRLRRVGYRTTIAVKGQELLKAAALLAPDLVLMDIMLKGEMDGVQIAQELRQRFGVPVVFLTAHTDESTLKRAESVEPYGYIIKPFDEKELYSAIIVALEKHRQRLLGSGKAKKKSNPRSNPQP